MPPLCGADHATLYFDLHLLKTDPRIETYLDFAHGNFDGISQELSAMDWWSILDNCSSMDELYHRFAFILHTLFAQFVPLKQRKFSFSKYPRHINNLIEQRNRLFCQLEDPLTSQEYRAISANLEKHIKKFRAFKDRKLAKMNSQSLFSYIRPILSEQSASRVIFDEKGKKYRTDPEKAEGLAHYFADIFEKSEHAFSSECNIPSQHRCSSIPDVSPQEVLAHLRMLKPSTFRTSDGIPQIVFKRCANQLALPVSIIINLSFRSGQIPNVWRHGIVVPIPKKSNASLLSDFRPICLNAVVCKVAEKFVRKKLLAYCLREHILPTEQYGFLEGSSTTLQLVACDHHWKKAFAQGYSTDVLYFDLSKAFDKLSIPKLIQKLYDIGIQGNLLGWVISYLSDRSFSVRFASATSCALAATSGVPQGGVLSPLLFILYTRELPSLLAVDHRVRVVAYADDIKVYGTYTDCDRDVVRDALRSSLQNILTWGKLNDIHVNLKKELLHHFYKRVPEKLFLGTVFIFWHVVT
ncbi:hypothetical protein Y032_0651g1152 [Ancylostoma ceylanicum]|uniref:Reverse transcriptase domain-containing protein n=1 Tax=Ancylostoma ceylanicum TaxID=53326 RepID=A0A016WKP1_9BILA|nr:hypothetical protein Y032_0651g1152 [Ancylostoma ceylanicum]